MYVFVLSALKPQLLLHPSSPAHTDLFCSPNMPAKAKAKAKVAKVTQKMAKVEKPSYLLAIGFRNVLKYRASADCKKALTVWGSQGGA